MEKSELEKSIAELKVEIVLGNFIEKIESSQVAKGNIHIINNSLACFGGVCMDNQERGLGLETFSEYKKRDREEYKEIINVLFELIDKHGYGLGY